MAILHLSRLDDWAGSGRAPDGTPGGDPAVLTRDQVARLLELARALAGACTHAAIVTIAAERARVLTGASAAQLAERREDGRLAVLTEPTGGAPGLRAAPFPSIRSGAPEHAVVRSGLPVWVGSRAEAGRWPDLPLDALPGGPDGAAWAFLPLLSDGDVSGVLTLAFDAAQAFDEPTRAFLEEFAAACGHALARGSLFTHERARANASEKARVASEDRERRSAREIERRTHLYERERFARARAEAETVVAVHLADDLEQARRLTSALYVADTARDVLAALAAHGVEGFGALALELTRSAAGGALETVATAGPPRLAAAPGVPGATAEAEVLGAGVPLWLDPEELARRFPGLSQALHARGAGSWLGVPVRGEGGARAVLSVVFPRARAFTPGDRERLALLAEECALALSRVELAPPA